MADEVYYVEKILDKKIENGAPRYFIKWQGYGPKHNSWEPAGNLPKNTVDEFESLLSKRPVAKKQTAKRSE